MGQRIVAQLQRDDVKRHELILNKFYCAKQAASPAAVPPNVPRAAAEKFFRESLFALGDAKYLVNDFWQGLTRKHQLDKDSIQKMFIHYGTGKLMQEED
jgi:hypothetical protein